MVSRRDMLQSGVGALIASAVGPVTVFAQAADYPNKPIHTICMFPPGSGADIIVRFFAKKLSDVSGKTVVVENKAGAFGNIASEAVARSSPMVTRSTSRQAPPCSPRRNTCSTSCPSIP